MDIQTSKEYQMVDQNRKNSQNTCNSSIDLSPNSDGVICSQNLSKSFNSLQTMQSSPSQLKTPLKLLSSQSTYPSTVSISNLQKRSYSQKQVKNQLKKSLINKSKHSIYKSQKINKKAYRKLSMQNEQNEQSMIMEQENTQTNLNNQNKVGQKQKIYFGSIIIQNNVYENTKNNFITQNNKNFCAQKQTIKNNKFNQKVEGNKKQTQKNDRQLENKNSQNKIQNVMDIQKKKQETKPSIQKQQKVAQSMAKSTSIAPNKTTTNPSSAYLKVRPQLYSWMRNICFKLNMCLDVFVLSMKYLDQYHTTYQNPYNRNTFIQHAYAIIILASKVSNKKILTPKIIGPKINYPSEQLQKLQIKLIKMMNFQVYYHTWIKQLQIYTQKWQEIIKKRQLQNQFSLFKEQFDKFKNYYKLIREMELLAKQNMEFVNQQIIMKVFVKVMYKEFRHSGKLNLLVDVLKEMFIDEQQQFNQDQSKQKQNIILAELNTKTNQQFENKSNQDEAIVKAYDIRYNKQLHPSYSIFLNSVFQIQL